MGSVAATLAVIATVAVQGQRLSSDPDPAPNPPEHGLTSVHGVAGDGGLRLESDLAVGQATAVVTNDTDVFVVTAADGAYHRLRLPGYDPALHDGSLNDELEEFDGERPGVALSPDGRRLAYAWHAPIATDVPAWEEDYHVASGVRVVDLTTGAFALDDPPSPFQFAPHHTFWSVDNLDSHLRWSSDGRYVVFQRSFGIYTGDWVTEGGPVVGVLDTSRRVGAVQGLASPLRRLVADADTGARAPFVSGQGGAVVVDEQLIAWHHDGTGTGPPSRSVTAGAAAPSPRAAACSSARWGSATRCSTSTSRLVSRVEVRVLDREQWPEGATIELLGTAGPNSVIASVHRVTDGKVADDADLLLLALSPSDSEANATVVGHVTDTSGSALSFATDLVAAAQ